VAAAAVSGGGDFIRRRQQLQGKAEGAGSSGGKAEKAWSSQGKAWRAASRVVVAASLALSLSLSSLFIGGDWLGLRGGCSWASCNRPIGP
jgi:hypothetical protein